MNVCKTNSFTLFTLFFSQLLLENLVNRTSITIRESRKQLEKIENCHKSYQQNQVLYIEFLIRIIRNMHLSHSVTSCLGDQTHDRMCMYICTTLHYKD